MSQISLVPLAYRKGSLKPTIRLGLLCLGTILAASNTLPAAAQSKELHVDAAADLQTVLPTLAAQYEQAKGVKLIITYGSSGTLATQILNGAPADLFLSADYVFPEKIVAENLADTKDPTPYARGTLVLWARKDSPLQPITIDTLSDPRVKSVAIADEFHAPYGRAAAAALTHMKLYEKLKPNLVIGQNIAQAAQFVESGNAQLGLISLTAATSEHFKQIGTFILVPKVTYPEMRQCAVVLVKSGHRTEAHAFLDWLLSGPVQDSLPKLGLQPIE